MDRERSQCAWSFTFSQARREPSRRDGLDRFAQSLLALLLKYGSKRRILIANQVHRRILTMAPEEAAVAQV